MSNELIVKLDYCVVEMNFVLLVPPNISRLFTMLNMFFFNDS